MEDKWIPTEKYDDEAGKSMNKMKMEEESKKKKRKKRNCKMWKDKIKIKEIGNG